MPPQPPPLVWGPETQSRWSSWPLSTLGTTSVQATDVNTLPRAHPRPQPPNQTNHALHLSNQFQTLGIPQLLQNVDLSSIVRKMWGFGGSPPQVLLDVLSNVAFSRFNALYSGA